MAEMEQDGGHLPSNPLEPATQLKDPSESNSLDKSVHPQQVQSTEDSAVTKAEKYERHGFDGFARESPSKRIKLENFTENGDEKYEVHGIEGVREESPSKKIGSENMVENEVQGPSRSERQKGVAPIKQE